MSRADVPGAWYDLSIRLSAALAVLKAQDYYVPCGERCQPVLDEISLLVDLNNAATELVELCKQDCDRLELELLGGEPTP